METSEWWHNPEIGRTIAFDVKHKMENPGVEGDAVVELSVELWHQIIEALGYEPLDGPPPVG